MAIDLIRVADSVARALVGAGMPLSDDQRIVLTGALSVWAINLADAVREQDARRPSRWMGSAAGNYGEQT